MPYELQHAGSGYYVVNQTTGKRHSNRPLPRARAVAQMRRLYQVEHKAYTLDDLEYAALKAVNPERAAVIAARLPLAALKGEQLAPGVTRIRGDLCNIHGRWGACSSAGFGAKPKKGGSKRRAARAAKPKPTPEQRAQARATEHAANRAKVLNGLGIDAGAQQALDALRDGKQPDESAIKRAGLEDAGLVERAADGSLRMTASGRAALSAADSGDAGRAGSIISAARDRLAARRTREAAAEARKRAVEERRKKRAEDAAAKRGSGSGGKKRSEAPAPDRETARQVERNTNRATVRGATGLGHAADALYAFADGGDLASDQAAGLVDAGMVEQDRLGGYRLSAAGRAFVTAANRGDARAAQDALSRGRDRVAQQREREQRAQDQQRRPQPSPLPPRQPSPPRRPSQTVSAPRPAPIVRPSRRRTKASDPDDYLVIEDRTPDYRLVEATNDEMDLWMAEWGAWAVKA